MPDYRYVLGKIAKILRFVLIIIAATCVVTGVIEHHPRVHGLYLWFVQKGTYWQFWYFGSMILIYLLAPLLCRLVESKYCFASVASCAAVCTVVFFLNKYIDFEHTYICQTFRLWNWCLYFMLGACLKQYGVPKVHWVIPVIMAANCALLVAYGPLKGVEYYHCSLFSALYSLSVFCAVMSYPIEGSSPVSELSKLFLPVYTFHPFFYRWYARLAEQGVFFLPSIHPAAAYVERFSTVLIVSILTSWLIMKLPYMDRVFKL